MKKLMIAAAVAVLPMSAAFAAATVACASGVATPIVADATKFIRNGMNVKCSANVNMQYDQGAVAAAVGANSIKGKNTFAGSTLGGTVSVSAACAAACTAAETATAVAAVIPSASL